MSYCHVLCRCYHRFMEGIFDARLRNRCYDCGGVSLTAAKQQADRDAALERLKENGLISSHYHFQEAS